MVVLKMILSARRDGASACIALGSSIVMVIACRVLVRVLLNYAAASISSSSTRM